MAMHPLFDLTGRRALVAGSSWEIGVALSRGLAGAGASVVLNSRDTGTLAAAGPGLAAEGLTVDIAAFDATDPTAVEDAIAGIEARLGPISVLVNGASILQGTPPEVPERLRQELVATKLDSVFLLTKAVGARMVRRGAGKIIIVGSALEHLHHASSAAHGAFLQGLIRGLCAEWAGYGLQVNGVAPAWAEGEMPRSATAAAESRDQLLDRTPAGRLSRLEDLIGSVVYLASRASDFVSGHTIVVDGGMPTMARSGPQLLRQRLDPASAGRGPVAGSQCDP